MLTWLYELVLSVVTYVLSLFGVEPSKVHEMFASVVGEPSSGEVKSVKLVEEGQSLQ